ncbi:MAG TPA: sigma-E factor negative regulatory protein [Gammaproteobacteria bacterium]|nr:sigma-E factor negative regulatory protein [Gammaproteobacteria bacterium]
MTEKLREQVSALADDSLLSDEHALLLRRFAADRGLRLCWERYHLIGEALRGGLSPVDLHGFADRVMAVLDAGTDAPAGKPERDSVLAWFGKAFAGIAVAASVAAVAVIGLRHDAVSNAPATALVPPSEIVPAGTQLDATLASYSTSPVSNAAWNGAAPEVQAQLGNYLINHNETAAALPQPGVLPYFYVATYDPRAAAGRVAVQSQPPAAEREHRNHR